MKRTVLGVAAPLALVATVFFAATVFSQSPQLPSGPAHANESFAPHPLINNAINALQNAKGDLEVAAHVYCNHRAEALEAVNHALEQLHRAIECADKKGASAGDFELPAAETVAVSAGGGAPHPMINRAINALSRAQSDLQNAAHDYCGHRQEALDSVNHALEQLRRAIECEK
jgi:hypothetical protein